MTSDLCLAWDVGSNNLGQIETPVKPDRNQWLHNLAYANWTIEEVRNGTVWRRFRPHIENIIN